MFRPVLLAFAFGPLLALPASAQPAPEASAPAALAPIVTASTERAPDLVYGAYQRGNYQLAMREALKRLNRNANDTAAMTMLGQLALEGTGVKQDFTQAEHWFRLAANLGDREAQYALGSMLLQGRGVAKNRTEARAWFEKASAQEQAGALYNLGIMTIEDVTVNQAPTTELLRAAQYFRRSARAGNSDAAYALAVFYQEGRGVSPDPVQAAEWMRQCAEAHNLNGMVEYAIMLFNGDGVAKDEAKAAKLFLKAAWMDDPLAENRVARIYATGRGLPQDLIQAGKWHVLARTAGVADQWLDDTLKQLTPDQWAEVQTQVRKFIANLPAGRRIPVQAPQVRTKEPASQGPGPQ
ncbi:tetratricopeptide repeat protein [Methylovirgula sp. 4M-Z18]|uniref:tetratricopeptide repeat protein n=1 Tax=Methylovirgula sp. 4M-Z18 TaxID=2293567 RepID=UPI000E2F8A94|nr:tetratricopeptide repeat protein [Methylovirgula sp. 4M-Z18]RFB78710.1 sel1 repeat family protein [Methylovirgula sp. 4M-Z18]